MKKTIIGFIIGFGFVTTVSYAYMGDGKFPYINKIIDGKVTCYYIIDSVYGSALSCLK